MGDQDMNMKPIEIADETLKAVSGGSNDQETITAQKLKEKLNGKTVQVTLVYTVSAKDIAAAIKEQLDVYIDKRSIELPEIKNTGTYHFKVKIASGVVAAMAVTVI